MSPAFKISNWEKDHAKLFSYEWYGLWKTTLHLKIVWLHNQVYYTSLINVIVKSHIIYPSQFAIHSYCCFHLSLESHPLIREEITKQQHVKLLWLVLNSWGLDITHDKTTYSIWSIMWRLIDIRKTEENATVPARLRLCGDHLSYSEYCPKMESCEENSEQLWWNSKCHKKRETCIPLL